MHMMQTKHRVYHLDILDSQQIIRDHVSMYIHMIGHQACLSATYSSMFLAVQSMLHKGLQRLTGYSDAGDEIRILVLYPTCSEPGMRSVRVT